MSNKFIRNSLKYKDSIIVAIQLGADDLYILKRPYRIELPQQIVNDVQRAEKEVLEWLKEQNPKAVATGQYHIEFEWAAEDPVQPVPVQGVFIKITGSLL